MTGPLTIHLLRHAHSSHAIAGERDHHRSLDDRGLREVRTLKDRLAREPVQIDRIVCSTARRARLTLEPLLASFDTVPVIHDDGLYALGPDAYEAAIRQSGGARRILLVGHNPTIQTLLHRWCPADGERLASGVGTAFWATLHLRLEADGTLRDGHLVRLMPPLAAPAVCGGPS